jgi:phage/plasmid-like protein (TIGR03299 family)
MAHEVEMIDGQAQMAYAGDVPWHGLGTKVSNELSPLQMMEKAGLDWEVEKHPLIATVNGQQIESDKKALVRMSDLKILDTVGPDWNPIQNKQAFEFFHEFVLSGDMNMHTAGSLKGGQQTWALAKVNESFDIFGGDVVESYLLFSNPHKYGQGVNIRFTPIRVVCNNTLTMSLNGHANMGYKSGHRSEFNADQVKETLGLAHSKFAEYKKMAEFLGGKRVTGEALIEYFATVFPKTTNNARPEKVEDLSRNAQLAHAAMATQPGADFAPESWWQAFNAATYVTDHLQGRTADNRLYSQWFGTNQARKVTALGKAVKMAEVA